MAMQTGKIQLVSNGLGLGGSLIQHSNKKHSSSAKMHVLHWDSSGTWSYQSLVFLGFPTLNENTVGSGNPLLTE